MLTNLLGGGSYTSYTSYHYHSSRGGPTPQETIRSESSVFKPLQKRRSSSVPALSTQCGYPPPQSPPASVASQCEKVLQDVLNPAHAGLMEFPDLTQRDFEVLSCFLDNTNALLEKPRMTYSSEEHCLIVEWPSTIHEAPLEDLNIALTSTFPSLPYPRKAVHLMVALNFPIKTTKLTATPDAMIAMTSTRGPKKLQLLSFYQACDEISEDVLKGPIVAVGHTWCTISSVDYYVWLKEEAVPINIADEDGEYSVHGTLPGNVNMDHVQILLNKGFELIKNSLISFCKEINPDTDCTNLEQLDSALPPTWDHFLGWLANATQIIAHQCYIAWYQDSFRGIKRSSPDSDYNPAPEDGSSSKSNSTLANKHAYPHTCARTLEMSNMTLHNHAAMVVEGDVTAVCREAEVVMHVLWVMHCHGGCVPHSTPSPDLTATEQPVPTPPVVVTQPTAMDPLVTTQPAGPTRKQAPAARDPLPCNHHCPCRYRASSPQAAAAPAAGPVPTAKQSEPQQSESFDIGGFSNDEEEEDMRAE
ncbi:hypothetical protein PAXRUDRAFT_26731 [Paxillus rubicundulus Ve08.2h10]|uniref:Uncharacterized protein n=1 Tax=Paxillus rubicundulus Ve08.2h10 TaxID=930991 RepID=A0A0D0DLU8_9AGAM|nr:hypothetical protein PAXRUDRAFT_26731 [Paxillus rubicundulus Ve08.2h10]